MSLTLLSRIKYDLKKIEEVVYDVSLRNLNITNQSAVLAAAPNAPSSSPAQPMTFLAHSGAAQLTAATSQSVGSSDRLEAPRQLAASEKLVAPDQSEATDANRAAGLT